MAPSQHKLFQPIKVGNVTLQHRVVLAPLTRMKADENHVPSLPLVAKYYGQRSTTPGTLLITEATFIAPLAGGYNNIPGIWSDEQVKAWKEVTDTVHAKGSFIYLQLWSLGRAADTNVLEAEGLPYVSASDVPLVASIPGAAESGSERSVVPRPLSKTEIAEYVRLYAQAASNAVHGAGFDGVEVHTANGYLLDQFLQDISNRRTDEYGGSVENRARFPLEVVAAVVKAVGAERTGIRVSPWSTFQAMRMADPRPTYTYLVSRIRDLYPNFSYLHAIEAAVSGVNTRTEPVPEDENNDFLRAIWSPRPFISTGGYDRQRAIEAAERKGDIVAFGRHFLSNPDLPSRLMKNQYLTRYDRSTFYVPGDFSGVGYTDYPFAYDGVQASAHL